MLNNTSHKPFTRSAAKKAKEQEMLANASSTNAPLDLNLLPKWIELFKTGKYGKAR